MHPPLGLYVHLPWCVRKCPYCDFNSHELRAELPETAYVEALLADLAGDVAELGTARPVESVFFGGGTPSLFSAGAIARILEGARARLPFAADAEITLEANPGTVEHDSFRAYRRAGINRVSLGVQSFDDAALGRIGRIHDTAQVHRAIDEIHAAGIDNFNLDLMYGLPGQTAEQALHDVRQAIAARPAHISHYELTLEPNTLFAARPPELPDEEIRWDMQDICQQALAEAGLRQYEVSAHARDGRECRHNRNYWRYGDYLGIGAGAHAKLTLPDGRIRRTWKQRNPRAWLRRADSPDRVQGSREVTAAERRFEFMLNALRLREGFDLALFTAHTGLPAAELLPALQAARERGLLDSADGHWRPSALGWRHLNTLQALFLPADQA